MHLNHDGSHLVTSQELLDELKLFAGQSITEEQVFAVIAANGRRFVRSMEKRSLDGLETPDISGLKNDLGMRKHNIN